MKFLAYDKLILKVVKLIKGFNSSRPTRLVILFYLYCLNYIDNENFGLRQINFQRGQINQRAQSFETD